MFTYLDESGDPGFKRNQGSSDYFIVALILVDDPDPVEARIQRFRHECRLSENFEFKFYGMNDHRRLGFLHMAASLPVRIRLLILDKRLVTYPHPRKREKLYDYLLSLVLANAFGSIAGGTLVIDESDRSRTSQQTLSRSLRQAWRAQGRAGRVITIKYRNSRSLGALQLADVVAGAATRAYRDSDRSYLELVQELIEDEWRWMPHAND